MIKLNIKNKKIKTLNLEPLVEGNINSTLIQFIFSDKWSRLARIAVFTNGENNVAVPISSDMCTIPREVLKAPNELYVSLRGIGESGNYVICTRNESLGKVEKSNASADFVDAEDVAPNVIDALLADVAELKANGVGTGSGAAGKDGKSAYEIAVDNGFIGAEQQWLASLKGERGPAGADGATWHLLYDVYIEEGQLGDFGLCLCYDPPFVPYDVLQWQDNNGVTGWYKVGSIKGADGNAILVGNSTPSIVRRNEGDIFINNSTWDIYAYKAEPVEDWVLKGSIKGTKGANGADGHTPVKGTDYWTNEDKLGIVDDVLAALPNGDEVSY